MDTLNATSAAVIHAMASCFQGLGEADDVLTSAFTAGVFIGNCRSRETVIVIFFPSKLCDWFGLRVST